MTTWQPISSAPKDQDVLVFVPSDSIGVARFHTYVDRSGGWWQWDWMYVPEDIIPTPTHWMPLPTPPCSDAVDPGAPRTTGDEGAHESDPSSSLRERITQEQKDLETRVVDSQYAAPLATASSNKPVPSVLHRFLARLPCDIEAPEAVIEADGDVAFDWDKARGWVVSASVREGDGRVVWAATLDSRREHGTFWLPDWPESFAAILTAYGTHQATQRDAEALRERITALG
jgi:hypothetical protein